MKNLILNLCAAVLFLSASAFTPAANCPTSVEDIMVNVPAGTVISVELNEEISANDLQAGNTLDFTVRTNVTVGGQVVFAAGALAEGRVKKVTAGCNGTCANLVIEVTNALAVDGQRVYLRSRPHIIKAPCCSGCTMEDSNATLFLGTSLSATIQGNVTVNA